jgi:hypothetical protein
MTTNTAITNGVATRPVNGQPTTLLEVVEHEALAYRAWHTAHGDFLAAQLERLAQLIRWTGASTPEEHEARMEVWDETLREQWYERGMAEAHALMGRHHA